jgi:GMP synthase (glutamine-hydrolysing)
VVRRFGDFPEWSARPLAPLVRLRVVQPYAERLPSLADLDGILVTGSLASVTRPEPWMDDAARFLRDATRSLPVLGVCFGHQLLAWALGGRVERNPAGLEAGTGEVRLTAAGRRNPLFAGMPDRISAQQMHEDHVPVPPPGATLLAEGAMTPVQAFASGRACGIQFHPELEPRVVRCLVERDRGAVEAHVPGGAEAVLASIRETPDAARVLHNWAVGLVGA